MRMTKEERADWLRSQPGSGWIELTGIAPPGALGRPVIYLQVHLIVGVLRADDGRGILILPGHGLLPVDHHFEDLEWMVVGVFGRGGA